MATGKLGGPSPPALPHAATADRRQRGTVCNPDMVESPVWAATPGPGTVASDTAVS